MLPIRHMLNVDNIKIILVEDYKHVNIATDFPDILPEDRRIPMKQPTILNKIISYLRFNESNRMTNGKVIKYEGPAEFVDNMMYFTLETGEKVSVDIDFAKKAFETSLSVFNGLFKTEGILQFVSGGTAVIIDREISTYAVLIHYSGNDLIKHIKNMWGRVEVHE